MSPDSRELLRLECLKLAVQAAMDPENTDRVIPLAERFFQFCIAPPKEAQ
jgi:hypothetical protein